ncbi:ULP PROTEASE domain-containing protein [Aphis craccivora]|uniref:ULP PROTEASE domain-containing protein n=1 Tax=Aphis craccivora TaxID=307492 RepID=A0A6G0Y0B7_APHCR|nr:ULP PROTEASE domain-containing protein [Aphis craccivora]
MGKEISQKFLAINILKQKKVGEKKRNNTNISNPPSTSSTTTAHENNLSPKVLDDIESVVFLECDNEAMFTVDEPISNDVAVNDLSKPLSENCLMKSVSTPGSHKSPFRQLVQSIDLYQNMGHNYHI